MKFLVTPESINIVVDTKIGPSESRIVVQKTVGVCVVNRD